MPRVSQTEKVYSLHVDEQDLKVVFADMNIALKKATVNALNVIGRESNKEIATDIKKTYNIKTQTLKIGKTVKLLRADSRKSNPVFTIRIRKRVRGLFLYGATRRKKGVSVKVRRTRKIVKKAFLVRSRQGKMFVARKDNKGGKVERISKSGTRYMAPRSKFLIGPSLAQLYSRRKSRAIIVAVIQRKYKKELNDQFDKQFEKRK
jgi:hypothetical protein